MEMMTRGRFRHVPVLDDQFALCGMISIGDVVKTRIAETVSEASSAARLYLRRGLGNRRFLWLRVDPAVGTAPVPYVPLRKPQRSLRHETSCSGRCKRPCLVCISVSSPAGAQGSYPAPAVIGSMPMACPPPIPRQQENAQTARPEQSGRQHDSAAADAQNQTTADNAQYQAQQQQYQQQQQQYQDSCSSISRQQAALMRIVPRIMKICARVMPPSAPPIIAVCGRIAMRTYVERDANLVGQRVEIWSMAIMSAR